MRLNNYFSFSLNRCQFYWLLWLHFFLCHTINIKSLQFEKFQRHSGIKWTQDEQQNESLKDCWVWGCQDSVGLLCVCFFVFGRGVCAKVSARTLFENSASAWLCLSAENPTWLVNRGSRTLLLHADYCRLAGSRLWF